MGLLSFLQRKADHQATLAPARPVPAPAALPAAAAQPILSRDEIIDSKNRLCGYRFALHAGEGHAPVPEAAFFGALVEARIPEFAERRLAIIPLTLDAVVFKRHLPLLAPNTVFLIDRERVNLPVQQLAGRLLALKESGCKVALRHISTEPDELALLEACDIAVLHLGDATLAQFQALTRQLRALYPALALAADGVESWDEQRMCLAWGCQYCLGEFLGKTDTEQPDAKVEQGRLTALEMLNLLRSDAELGELAEVAKHDPGITFQVLKWANSPATGLSSTVTSLSQAIIVLGRSHLYRWLTVSMYRLGKNRERDEALLEVALTRARFLEAVAGQTLSADQRDEMFLVGLLSMFDVLLGMPMPKILAKMHLSAEVQDVLLRSVGPYGQYLMLALLVERGMAVRAAEIGAALGIAPGTLGATSTAAFQWAQESLRHTLAE